MRVAALFLFLAATAAAQTPPSGTTYGYTKVDLSQTGTNNNPIKVVGTITGGTITAIQGNPPWRVTVDTGSITSFQGGTWSVQALQSGSWHVTIDTGSIRADVSGSSVTAYAPGGAALALDATANSLFKAGQSIGNSSFGASQTGAWTVTANQGTSPWAISAAALPLPAGAATSARQDAQTSELVAIDSNTAAAFRAGQSIGNATFGASQSGAWTVTANQGSPPWRVSVDTGSITAFQGGAWSVAAAQSGAWTVTSNQGGQWLVATSSAASSVQASQLGAWTVTANQGGAPWSVTFPSPQAVTQSGAPWQVNQAGSFVVTPGTGTWAATQSGSWSVGLNAGSNQIGLVSGSSMTAYQGGNAPWIIAWASSPTITVTNFPAITNGVGTSTAMPTLPLTEANRQTIVSSATAVAATAADTIFTLTTSTDYANGISGTSFGVPSGKVFKITTFQCVWIDSALADGSGICRLRVSSSGACTATSPIVAEVAATGQNAGVAAGRPERSSDPNVDANISGTMRFCASHIEAVVGPTVDVIIRGIQY